MKWVNLRIEDELMLLCSRVNVDEHQGRLSEILQRDLDWEYLLKRGKIQGILPLLYHHLKNEYPEEKLSYLRRNYHNVLIRNTILNGELQRVLAAFRAEGIETVVLKGAHLAEQIYRNIALRPMIDIDILVKEKDLEPAKKEMWKLDYAMDLHGHSEEYVKEFNRQWGFFLGKNLVNIELHTDIVPRNPYYNPYSVDLAKLWGDSEEVAIAGVKTRTLSPEDTVVHLCLHLDSHRIPRLIWLCDIFEVINATSLDWDSLLVTVKDFKCGHPLQFFLGLISQLYHIEIPLSESRGVNWRDEDPMKFMAPNRAAEFSFRYGLMHLNKIPGHLDRLRFIRQELFPPLEHLADIYQMPVSRKLYIHYLTRPIHSLGMMLR